MTDYPPEMYNEIVEYHNFRYGKFSEIPYPNITISEKDYNSWLYPKKKD